jgi:tRNA threonylcarbamoyladenosine biosynthesis protein TsaE
VPTLQTLCLHLNQLPDLASWLAVQLKPGDIVTLDGPLGAGKTTFSRAVGTALDLAGVSLSSPTFTLVNEYQEGHLPFLHADLYRLGTGEAADRFTEELLYRQAELGAVLWVEWASLSPTLVAQSSLSLKLAFPSYDEPTLANNSLNQNNSAQNDQWRNFEITFYREGWTSFKPSPSAISISPRESLK